MNKKEMKDWIEVRLAKSRTSLNVSVRNSIAVQELLIKHTPCLVTYTKESVTFSQRTHHIYHDLETFPLCQCGAQVGFDKQTWKYFIQCSKQCYRSTTIGDKLKASSLAKFGVVNFSMTDESKANRITYNLKKYGVKHYQTTDEFKRKSKATCLEKYGHEMYPKTIDMKQKSINTLIKKYGVNHYSKTHEFKTKIRQTCEDRFPNGLPFSNTYKHKLYTMPSGVTIQLQGYENYALDILLETHHESDILAGTHEVASKLGKIMYEYDGPHRYYPDIFIEAENKIIEVKSHYFYYKDYVKNLAKRDECIRLGYNFEFWIIKLKGGFPILAKA